MAELAAAEARARSGYDKMADEYTTLVTRETGSPSLDLAGLEFFAQLVQRSESGRVLDAGCGPGHITGWLAGLGLDISGVDISPELVAIARAAHPELSFSLGTLAALPFENDSLDAVVSRHSLIHTPAELIPLIFAEFARVLAPNGLLCLSFFGSTEPGSHGQPFDHAVTTAYQFDVDAVASALLMAGLVEQVRMVRQPEAHERQLPNAMLFALQNPLQ